MPIRFQVLGGLHAFRDDVPYAWVPAQHTGSALLVFLALERDVTREQLARVFWPDEELEAARHALRQAPSEGCAASFTLLRSCAVISYRI